MTEKTIKTHAMPIALSISGKTSDTIRLAADNTKVVNPVAAPRALDGKSLRHEHPHYRTPCRLVKDDIDTEKDYCHPRC